MVKKLIIVFSILFSLAILVWIYFETEKEGPGQKIEDLGRDHVEVGTEVKYNSNPPTSGPHYTDWIRFGVLETPRDDRYLVHSLEHGFVIISYNCSFKRSLIPQALAHGLEEEEATASAQSATPSAQLSEEFKSDDCHKLVDNLIQIYEKKGKNKLIVIPRPNLDVKVALTAWGRLDKFNPSFNLSNEDKKRIESFIDAYKNKGPEQTME